MKPIAIKSLIISLFAVAALTIAATPSAAHRAFTSNVPNPTVTGPIPVNVEPGDPSHDYIYFTPDEDLSDYGYVEEEFFIEGVANQYDTTTGGTGTIISSEHPYRTRIVVRRPMHRKRFNGVVILEWQNVTAGYELDAHWAPSWEHFIREGYVWVGVSAQLVGVHGFPPPRENNGLIAWSPTRYHSLDLTDGGTVLDDSLCYDVFAQAAQAIKHPKGTNPLGKLRAKMVIAAGASQSAGRLSVYHNSIEPLHEIFDGYYLLVGGSGLRTDLDVKVFQYLSETDLGYGPTRRMEDSDHFRSWEVTGSGHSSYVSDVYRTPLVLRDFGTEPWPTACDNPPFSRVRGYHVINRQYDLLVRWIKKGIAPPVAPKIEFTDDDPPVMIRDGFGIAAGGIRLPEIDVPTALNSGMNSGSTFCFLYGTHIPFDDETLSALYPSHGGYVRQVAESIVRNRKDGYITRYGAFEMLFEAIKSDIGR